MKVTQVIEGLKDPKDNPCWKGYHPVGTKKKNGKTVPNCVPKESVEEMYGRRRSSYGYNPDRDAEREWDAARRADQDFKNRERNAGLEDEEEYYQQQVARQREIDRGPWYLKVNGKILKSKGEVKVFDWKKGANNYALAILKNKPELQGKIFLTKKNQDDSIAEAGELKVQKDDDKATILLNPATGVQTQIDKTNPNAPRLTQDEQGKLKLTAPQGAQDMGGEQKPNLVGKDVAVDANPVEDVHRISAPSSQPGGEITDVNPHSPISGDEEHDEISKLLNQRLRKLAGL